MNTNDFQHINLTTTGTLNPPAIRETDSLAEDSIQQYYQEAADNVTQGNNGYDFLIDEEYQQVKQLQQELGFAKWSLMGEKVSLNLILRQVLSDAYEQNQLLQLQKNPNLKAFKLSNIPTIREVNHQIKSTMSENTALINGILDKYHQLKFIAQQEQEKPSYLESQLNVTKQKSTFAQFSADSLDNRERYIEELETQLQDTRKQLLDRKLQLSDKEEEVQNLKRQLQNTDSNFQQLEEQKREIDELVIKVSQELRNKEYDLRDINYQVFNDKDHLARQVDILRKELQEERGRKNNLEQLEGDLIFKLQQREEELHQVKSYNAELEEKVRVNSEAIEKAQKVIERLNEEMDRTAQIMQSLEKERDKFKSEARDSSKRIVDLNKQVQLTQSQHQHSQQQVSMQLKQEIDELKEALGQYQQQFDEERRSLNMNLREANEDKYHLHLDKEKLDSSYKKQIMLLQQQLEDMQKQNASKIIQMEHEFQEQKDSLLQQVRNQEEQAQSQIKYLQKRNREIQSDNQTKTASQIQSQTQTTGKPSYLNVIKQEFEKIQNELMDTRKVVKQYSNDQNLIGIPAKLKQFEDFREKVIAQINDWEVKSEGLAQLSQKYEREIDEYRRMFQQMKQMIKEKDQFIQQIQKSVKLKDSFRDSYMNTVKKELDRQTYLIKADLLDQFKSTQLTAQNVSNEQLDQERRMQAFKQEYLLMLEDRENLSNSNLRLIGQVEVLNRDLDTITQKHYEFNQRIRVVMGVNNMNMKSDIHIVNDIESMIDELRIRNEEVISYRSQLNNLQNQQDQDKQFMQQKVAAVEEQLNNIQRSNLAKEEELQLLFMQKEAKLHSEIQKQHEELQQHQQHLKTRERQVKKLQEQKDSYQDEVNKLQAQLDQIIKEKTEMESECKQTVEVINQVQLTLETTQSELEKKQGVMQEQEGQIQKLEERSKQMKEQLYNREIELQRERDLNLQLQDEKYQAVLQRDSALEKQSILERENQNIYKDLVIQKETVREVSSLYDECEREKFQLQKTCEQMNEVVSQVQDEVVQSQRAIESLNHALDKTRRKYNRAKELKHQIKLMKQHEGQLNELIESMRRQLNPPKQSQEIQTNDSGMQELIYHYEENQRLQKQNLMCQRDIETLQDSISRQTMDINRLIEEKRDLEDLVDQQNQAIKQVRMNNQSVMNPNVATKENHNLLNSYASNVGGGTIKSDSDLYSKILQEKENYIMRLEHEISDMRKELDQLKEKLISYEIGSLSLDRSLGGHGRSMQVNMNNLKQSTNTGQGNQLKQQSQGFRLNNTYNSLHFSNMYNATNATNYQTLNQGTEDYNRGGALNRSMHN
ncbi:UNKNOWN [Stylonychia lemnae]|uniref:Uncharacterized protein n=1 Tax=Stylonychia lemnae TaxID=5949 RepID=A0A078BE03_STYLE|nr:UNKNOWN [Stylonychia lemnae]|eukprot:CDW91377.1 UNKNOWN [Stylonychia lemnae]